MSYHDDTIDWQNVMQFSDWLDINVAERYKDQPLAQDWARISKIGEELGETIQAFIGATGQNPRKGFSHTEMEMYDELCDTILTGIYALYHFVRNSSECRNLITRRMTVHMNRMNATRKPYIAKHDYEASRYDF